MSKRTLIKGAVFLTVTGFATRLLGFYNRIFLTRLIGVSQLGIYQLIFPIYILSYAISSQGISLALTKNISFYSGQRKTAAIKEVMRASILFSAVISITCAVILFLISDKISIIFLNNSECKNLLKTICFAIPFVAVKSCFNAFFVGLEQPFVQGTSHFYEQIIRISATYFLFVLFSENMAGARVAITAVVIGEIFSMLYSLSYYFIKRKKYVSYENLKTLNQVEKRAIRNRLIQDTIPLSINNITVTLFATVETILLPAMLLKYYGESSESLAMYGIMSGIVMPFILFPSTITNSISTMLMPSVSHAVAANDEVKIKKARSNTIYFCCALGIAAWIFFFLFGEISCDLTFKNEAAGKILSKIGFLCPLLYLAQTQSAILNGMGKTYKNLFVNLLSIAIRIVVISTLVPAYGIAAYIFAMVISYAVQNVLLIIFTTTHTESPDIHSS